MSDPVLYTLATDPITVETGIYAAPVAEMRKLLGVNTTAPMTITFYNDRNKEIGRLYVQDYQLHFDGDVLASAEAFREAAQILAGHVNVQEAPHGQD